MPPSKVFTPLKLRRQNRGANGGQISTKNERAKWCAAMKQRFRRSVRFCLRSVPGQSHDSAPSEVVSIRSIKRFSENTTVYSHSEATSVTGKGRIS